MEGLFTKRWFAFFLIYFVTWYPISLIIVTAYELTGQPYLFIAGTIFTPLWSLFISYMYFRHTRNDWTSRFITAFGWMALLFVGAAVLVQPVYGVSWTSIFSLEVLNANWINIAAIIVGGVGAQQSPTTT
jgi:hypothetical protein